MNSAICIKEQEMLRVLFCRNLLVPNRDTGPKWPSQRFGSARSLALYEIADGGTGMVEGSLWHEVLGTASLSFVRAVGWVNWAVGWVDVSMSILLFDIATLSA